jgi:hypothetical protein
MSVFDQLFTHLVVMPVYNLLVAIYATISQQDSGTTFVLVGIGGAALFLPAIIRNQFDQEQVRAWQERIADIQSRAADDPERQQKVLEFLKGKGVRFQSESIYLFGQAVILALVYPVLLNHWQSLDVTLLYDFTPRPEVLSPDFLNISLTQSSPTLSLIPAVLLFFELRQSYKEQQFLTGFIDKWYPVLLPLFTYFLIFWLPSGISLIMVASLSVSLYLKIMMQQFTRLRNRRITSA